MLSGPALKLIRDVFDNDRLFRNQPHVRKRVVVWGPDAKPLELEHSAAVVSEESLIEGLYPDLDAKDSDSDGGWNIYASRPLPATSTELRFGSRVASANPVVLKEDADPETCWIESLDGGWLFLITNAPGEGWLLSVGASPEELLAQCRLAGRNIQELGPTAGRFPAHPRIVSQFCGPGWLACGTAAMALDPLCGDGTAYAIREAILASAVIVAAERGGERERLLSHYEDRLTAGFRRHLEHCLGYYESGSGKPWWRGEVESMRRGLDWCDERLKRHGPFRYKLEGFELRCAE